jgi:BACON domain-containing protein
MRIFRDFGVALLACALVACGGGGGGGSGSSSSGGGSSSSSSSSSGGSVSSGEFTLSAASVTLDGYQATGVNPAQELVVTITGSGVAAVSAAYAAGQTPATWLFLEVTGSGTSYRLVVRAMDGFVPAGTYTAAFTVSTRDAAGAALQSRVFNVTYNLYSRLNLNAANISRTFQSGGATLTEVIPLPVIAANREWAVTTDAPWIRVPSATQSGSATFDATLDVTGLAPGQYTGLIRAANRAFPADEDSVVVSLTISPPVSPPTGSFTLGATSASFQVAQQGSQAPTQSIPITITSGNVTFVGAAYLAGQTQAPWLNINITGAGTSYNLVLGVVGMFMNPGSYTATFAVGIADAAGNVLQQQNVTVHMQVFARLQVIGGPVDRSYIFGDAAVTDTFAMEVQGPSRPWSLTSNASWLRVPAGNFLGNQSPNATIDVTGLAPGIYSGRVTAADNADPLNAMARNVSITVTAPTFSTPTTDVLFGGQNGDEALVSVPVNFTLTTGAGVHPYTATVTTDSDGAWLQVSNPMGMVGSTGATVSLSVSKGTLRGATRTGELRLSTNVLGTTYSTSVPVTWNHEWNRLVVSAAGVGFSSLPGRSVLTRTLRVFTPDNHQGTPWTAQSNQSWLTVTPSGTTNGNLTLTANPFGLASETTHFANVLVTSSDPLVENTQSVRVGLYISATAPAVVSFTRVSNYLAASPVEPLVAVSGGPGTDVHLYNVYNGTLERTLTGIAAQPSAIEFSGDGSKLFVYDRTNINVRSVNAVSGAQLASYNATSISQDYRDGLAIDLLRPNGDEILITPGGRIYNVGTGAQYTNAPYFAAVLGRSLDHSADQSLVTPDFGSISRFTRTALRGGGLEIHTLISVAAQDNTESCFNAAGDRVYTPYASGLPHTLAGSSVTTGQIEQQLPAGIWPTSLRCPWNGLIIGGSEYPDNITQDDIYVFYGPTGVSRGNLRAAVGGVYGVRLRRRGLEVSADGTRLIALYGGFNNDADGVTIQSLPTPQ